ncbi:MAG: choline-sulfatase [Rhodospirillales bacterium]|nr:choline-sulfatase [Rhodospirillales bacterium]
MTKQPNILFLMMDQLAPQVLKPYGGTVCRTPNLERLAAEGVVFENAYCNYPVCAPARYSLMSGRLPSRVGSYDNANTLSSEVPTFAHYLRMMGYHTCLSGKMHFVGPDQLHGFEDRVTTDVYPANFLWTTDWTLGPTYWEPWYHSMRALLDAGPWRRSVNVKYDEEVTVEACRWLHDHADRGDDSPFFLATSFISPHDPYLAPPNHWDLYTDDEIDEPRVGDIPLDERDPHSRRLYYTIGRHMDEVGLDDVRRARRAYYAVVTWLDERIGRVLETLEAIGERGNTIIVVSGDHGDMLGERGMWFKMSFHEWSARIPMIVHAPGTYGARRVRENVSLLDLFPTFLEWANDGAMPELFSPIDGGSMAGLASGNTDGWADTAYSEYCGEGAESPLLMVRRGRWKYVHCDDDPPLLYDLEDDPDELTNRAGSVDVADAEAELKAEIHRQWDTADLKERVIASQRARTFLEKALSVGKNDPWDWQPMRDASREYVRDEGDIQGIYDTSWSDQKR